MVIANYNNDVAEYWEWSGQGLFPVDTSNEAYKLGVNYMHLRDDALVFFRGASPLGLPYTLSGFRSFALFMRWL